MAGAAAGAAAASAAGQCSEKGINHSVDEKFQTSGGTFNDFSGGKFVAEMAFDGILGGVSAGTTATAGKAASRKAVGESLKEMGGGGVKRFAQKRAVEAAVAKPVTAVSSKGLNTVYNPRQ